MIDHPANLNLGNAIKTGFQNSKGDIIGISGFYMKEIFSKKIITDSGSIKKEAFILKKSCITVRIETELIETVSEKREMLINPSGTNIASQIAAFSIL